MQTSSICWEATLQPQGDLALCSLAFLVLVYKMSHKK
jgi:hypothetical protein